MNSFYELHEFAILGSRDLVSIVHKLRGLKEDLRNGSKQSWDPELAGSDGSCPLSRPYNNGELYKKRGSAVFCEHYFQELKSSLCVTC